MNAARVYLFAAFMAATGCQTLDMAPPELALLDNPGPEIRQELTATISEALGGRTINISPESFTRSSRLIIEPRSFTDPSGLPVSDGYGPNIEHFYLKKSGSDCFLFHEQSQTRHYLRNVRCRPAVITGGPE